MKHQPTDPRAFFTFVGRGISSWQQTASIVPSQRFLVRAMVEAALPFSRANHDSAQTIVELGPGAGVMTKPLLSRMSQSCKLFTVEIDESIHSELVRSVQDPRLTPILGSAEDLPKLLAANGHTGKVDTVVSSLGLSLIPESIRETILDAASNALEADGTFVQFGYMHTRYLSYTKDKGFFGFDYLPLLQKRFLDVQVHRIPLNFPPALVYVGRGHR